MATDIVYLYTETPLHAGMGSGLGTIDLPIQRERHTDFPMVQGSGIKGALRARARERGKSLPDSDEETKKQKQTYKKTLLAVFGPEAENAPEHAGAISVGDARLLLFPVRSLVGVFAWVTAPLVLRRFKRDLELCGKKPSWEVPEPPGESQCLLPSGSKVQADKAVVLEEYTFVIGAQPTNQVDPLAEYLCKQLAGLDSWWRERITTHLVVLNDTAFRDFVLYSTEVVTRIRLDENKIVQQGALWTEESLPTDTLLYVPMMARTPSRNGTSMSDSAALTFVRKVATGVLQLGGDETVGRGLVRPIWPPKEDAQ